MRKYTLIGLSVLVLYSLLASFQPQVVNAASFTHGPYLIDASESTVTVMWYTDGDATGSVEYGTGGNYSDRVTEVKSGLVSVSKKHSVRITGLTPGTTYNYRLVSTPVTDLTAYYPVTGEPITSAGYTFTTFDDAKQSFSFYYLTDTHGDISRINNLLALGENAGADRSDFVVHTGDIVDSVESESQLFSTFIDPVTQHFGKTKSLVFAHGIHDMRGHFARELFDYLPNSTGQWYYGFNHGPASFLVLDSAEDKPDSSLAYGGLVASETYRDQELLWLQNYVGASSFQNNPFKIILEHMASFGPVANKQDWINTANNAGVQLVLGGHNHLLEHFWPGEYGNNYHVLLLGQDQIAKVKVSSDLAIVTVLDEVGNIIYGFEVGQTPAVDTDYSGYNLAKRKTATATSSMETSGWYLSKVTDWNRDSKSGALGWSSNSNITVNHTESITIDLGKSHKVSRVDLYPRNDTNRVGEGFPIDFNIQLSEDNANWSTVATKNGYPKPGNSVQGIPFNEQNARYIKVEGTNLRPNPFANGNYHMQFAEIEAYGGNMAAHGSVTSSSSMEMGDSGWSAQAVTDTVTQMAWNSSYGWSSNSDTTNQNHSEWVTVDLGANSKMSKISLYPRNDSGMIGEGFPIDFKLKVSKDNINWTTVITKSNYAKPGNLAQNFTFSLQEARYVKVEGSKLRANPNNLKYYMQFAEIEVH